MWYKMSLKYWWWSYILTRLSQILLQKEHYNFASVRFDSKGKVCTIIKWTSSSTVDVCNGNRRPTNSRHTEVCHLRFNMYMCHGIRDGCNVFLTTVHAVLADSLLHYFLLREGRDLVHIQQYVSESVQSCDASKQLLQGEKQQKFYVRRCFIEFCKILFCNL
jgi:hypothetical protein